MPKVNADWMNDPATRRVMRALREAGHQAYFVGGCVRNALLKLPATDIDIATDATPDEVMAAARAAGLRTVPTGVDHGTVTVIADQRPFEVTTFRRDVETDGRRAVVAFARTMAEDAARRDFTINALYADENGEVLDPTGQGLQDLAARRIRFIGNPDDRIREDYLRILRLFRFHAWYGDPVTGLDPEAVQAVRRHLDGLALLSRERVGAEMLKLLAAPDPAPSVDAMEEAGVLDRVLPGARAEILARLVPLERNAGLAPDPIVRLAAIGGEDPAHALRLSRADARRLRALREAAESSMSPAELGYRLGEDDGKAALVIRCALGGQPLARRDLARIADGATARFPIRPADLMPALSGPELGARLKELERRWIASGFRLGREELLRQAAEEK
ncbi:MAG: CCA tRNA nucleotidyltransferase [Alphaproteobacteria bacterium]|nr:MAG: CCA tRNA nucleotidyltransferase [Alphaproteobacteria bacterium]